MLADDFECQDCGSDDPDEVVVCENCMVPLCTACYSVQDGLCQACLGDSELEEVA